MKIIITESQYNRIFEEDKPKVKRKPMVDDFIKVTNSTVQDDDSEEGGKIYGYYLDSKFGDMVPRHQVYVYPDKKELNPSMISRYFEEFMKYTGFEIDDIIDFIERNVVNNPKTFNLSRAIEDDPEDVLDSVMKMIGGKGNS
jgi:hypothetical protein